MSKRYPMETKLKIAWAIVSIVLGPILLATTGGFLYVLYQCVAEAPMQSLVLLGIIVVLWAFFWAWDTIDYFDRVDRIQEIVKNRYKEPFLNKDKGYDK